jgi:hypothetical protein
MKSKNYFLIFLILFFTNSTWAYLHNQTSSGVRVRWPNNVSLVDIFVNSQNSSGLNESDIQSIALSSATQWNGIARISLRKNSSAGRNQANLNEVYFIETIASYVQFQLYFLHLSYSFFQNSKFNESDTPEQKKITSFLSISRK